MDRNQRIKKFDKNQRSMDFPHDFVSLEILSRLPVKSIYRFRSVCRDWYSLPNDRKFVKSHMDRTLASNVIVMSYKKVEDPLSTLVSFYSVDMSQTVVETKLMFRIPLDYDFYLMEAQLDGLVCLRARVFNKNVYICNPSTHELVQLPQVDPRPVVAVLGFDCCTDTYKVLCAIVDPGHHRLGWCIYTLGSGEDRWRQLGWMPRNFQIEPGENAYMHGSVHWIIHYPYAILYFNFSDERFHRLPTPNCPSWLLYVEKHEFYGRIHLKAMDGYLRLIGTLRSRAGSCHMGIYIWTLKDYKNPCWTNDMAFSIDTRGQGRQGSLCYVAAAVDIRNDKMFFSSINRLYSHDLKSGILEEVDDGSPAEPFLFKDYLANYSESLLPVNRKLRDIL